MKKVIGGIQLGIGGLLASFSLFQIIGYLPSIIADNRATSQALSSLGVYSFFIFLSWSFLVVAVLFMLQGLANVLDKKGGRRK